MTLLERIHKLFFYECWACAVRALPEEAEDRLPDDGVRKRYRLLPTDGRHWAADPFLFSQGGKTFLFFEYMALHQRRACIACCQVTAEGFSQIRPVLCEPWHLSYPAVFAAGGEIYMIPESLESRAVTLYRAVEFPLRWERAAVLIRNFAAVDTTPYWEEGRCRLLLYDPDEPANRLRRLYTATLELNPPHLTGLRAAREYPEKLGRPAGAPFPQGGGLVRPTQDCRQRYGGAIRFCAFSGEGERYAEQCVGVLSPASVETGLPQRALGLHTINRGGGLEAIDLFYRRFSPLKPFRALKRRLFP